MVDLLRLLDVAADSIGAFRRPHVAPEYPELARRARLDGFVTLQVVLGKEGAVKDVSVLRGLGLGLDQAASTPSRSGATRRRCTTVSRSRS